MKNTKIFYKFAGFSGIFTTLLDIKYNLSQLNVDIPLNLKISSHIDNTRLRRFLSFISKYDINAQIEKSEDIIADNIIVVGQQFIADFYAKYYANKDIQLENFHCENLIVLDSACFFIANSFNILDSILEKINSSDAKRIIILVSKYNKILLEPFCTKYKKIELLEYYISFSEKRMNIIRNIQFDANKIMLADNYEKSKIIDGFEVHTYGQYNYNRWMQINDGNYYENIGKLLFEFSILNKKSLYSSRNKTMNDGMTSYMEAIGIDDNIDQDIMQYKNKIIDFFQFKNEDDILYKLL